MNNVLTYRGYSAVVEFDSEDMILTGRIAGLNDVVGFHAETPAQLVEAFHEAVDDYLEVCARLGKKPDKAFSGNVMFRVAPELHSRIARAAQLAGKSLNQWGEAVLETAAGRA
jgi:predicted HicB family RNase H-like nuclease